MGSSFSWLKRVPMGDGGTHEEPQREFQARLFAVNTTPYCIWDWGLAERNIEYLESLDPDYFDYIGRANLPHLGSDDPRERRRAATAIRTAYHHGLESFFALLFATLQSPWCVPGWMQAYSPADLRDMAQMVDPGHSSRGAQRERIRALREELLPYVWLRPRSFLRWESISRAVHRLDADEEVAARMQGLFGNLWHGFARDLVNDSFVSEYNSIKHGLRAGFGGFYMLIGPESTPGEPAPAEAMHSLGNSEHGSSFFTPRTFVESVTQKDRKARPGYGRGKTSHFRIRQQALNWDPEGLCRALSLISASLHNVRTLALWLNGSHRSGLTFAIPDEGTFQGPLGRSPGIAFNNMDSVVLEEDVRIFERDELEKAIKESVGDLRERLDPAPTEE